MLKAGRTADLKAVSMAVHLAVRMVEMMAVLMDGWMVDSKAG